MRSPAKQGTFSLESRVDVWREADHEGALLPRLAETAGACAARAALLLAPLTATDDHGAIPAHADRLLARLDTLSDLFDPAKVDHQQHREYVERARLLADLLRAIRVTAANRHYPAALAVARIALEHHLLDRLLFLATRWLGRRVKATAVAEEAQRLEAAGQSHLVRWWRDPKTEVTYMVHRGLFREGSGGRGPTLSRYYFRVREYDPFAGRAWLASRVALAFVDQETARRRATESAQEWRGAFVFEKLQQNLAVNRLLAPRLDVQVEVHYSFLSGFVHATQAGYALIYGQSDPSRLGHVDHYADELCLLYVVALAVAQLEVFGRMAKRAPRLKLTNWDDVERDVAAARRATEYFWFLSGAPHLYDRIQEINTRAGRADAWRRPWKDPMTLPPSGVRYYINPLERLVALHASTSELVTGQVFVSPFERSDASFRR